MEIKKSLFFITLLFGLTIAFQTIFAWNNPSQNPPNGSAAIVADTNNNIGIGTASPGAKLDIAGGSILLDATQSVYGYNPGTGSYGQLELYNGGTGNLTLKTTYSTGGIILTPGASGGVGVGTTSPAVTLSVQGNGLISNRLNVATLNATGTVLLATTSGTKVGIGVTSPEAAADIIGATQGTPTTYGSEVPGLIIQQALTYSNPGEYGPMLEFRSSGRGYVWTQAAIIGKDDNIDGGGGAYSGALTFLTKPVGGVGTQHGRRVITGDITERMIINGLGNVGIGTTTPATTLSVQGNGLISNRLNVASLNATGTVILATAASTYVGVGTASTDSNYKITTSGGGIKAESTSQPAGYFNSTSGYGLLVNAGNVGIGTLTPTEKLEIASNSNIRLGTYDYIGRVYSGADLILGNNMKADTAAWQMRVGNTHASYGYRGIRMYQGVIDFIGTDGSVTADTVIPVNTNVLMRIDTGTGNVGIGTGSATPGAKLDIAGGSILLDATQSIYGNTAGSGSYGQLELYNGSTGSITLKTTYSGGNILLSPTASGGVGIGTDSLLAKLDVDASTWGGSTAAYIHGAQVAITGNGSIYDFYASGIGTNYGPFTGGHEVKLINEFPKNTKQGMIVSVTGETQIRKDDKGETTISSTLPTVKLANSVNDKSVFGVFEAENPLPENHWYKPKDGERFGVVNALGEGRVLVTNINGNIDVGDYITTSLIAGYGQKQDDDILHSYTLGKATENVDWDKITETIEFNGKQYKIYLIAVVYTSG